MNFELPNYTGPYRSDGKFQTSVEFGKTAPKDKLDALSRLHDSAYAKYKDYGHRVAADSIYNQEAKKLVGKFPSLAGDLVVYGNQTGRSVSNLASNASYGPLGFVYGAVKNMYNLNDYMVNQKKYAREVSDYYDTDPEKPRLVENKRRSIATPIVDVENNDLPTRTDTYTQLSDSKSLDNNPSLRPLNEPDGPGGLRNGFRIRTKRRMYNPYC